MPMSWIQRTLLALAAFIGLLAIDCPSLKAETPAEEQRAIEAIQRLVSNLQKNRDGTVRFVRFSHGVVTDDHVEHVAAFRHLDYLAVVSPTVSDAGLKHIAGLTNLDTLYLSGSGLTDAGMPALEKLLKLERLYLDQTQVSDDGLASLSALRQLKTLSLNGTHVSSQGLVHLRQLEQLETLRLRGTAVDDSGLRLLTKCSKLKHLDLRESKVTTEGLETLAALPELELLDVSGTAVQIRDSGSLSKFPKLKHFLLRHSSQDTAGITQVRLQLPELNIELDPAANQRLTAFERYLRNRSIRKNDSHRPSTGSESADTTAQLRPVDEPVSQRLSNAKFVPQFQQHVIPLLGRLGCNGRVCHGSFQGRGGFRLSMFGYDFETDREALAGGEFPRVDIKNPDKSLVLLKPTMQEEHEGGLRFERDGWEHRLLKRWISNGARGVEEGAPTFRGLQVIPDEIVFERPGQTVQLKVIATWSDGSREDVTALTRFQSNNDSVSEVTADGQVTSLAAGDTYVISFYDNGIGSTQTLLPVSDRVGDHFPSVPTPTRIDELVVEKLSKLGIEPSELSSDEEFLRRVTLDMVGTLPTPDEIDAFVADQSPDKRSRWIDQLLERPAYVEWWTNRFCDLTGTNAQHLGSTDMNQPAAGQWTAWIRRRLQDNAGWDEITAGILLAISRRPGQSYDEYVAEQSSYMRRRVPEDFTAPGNPMHYYWFRGNLTQPSDRALSFGYVFLGMRLDCAQCHKHPFDQWSKQDFEQFTEFFTRIKTGAAPDAQQAQIELRTKLGVPTKLDTAALRRQMYMRVAAEGKPIPWFEVYLEPPRSEPHVARLLGGSEVDLNQYSDPREPLMHWLTDPEDPVLARAFVNRIWAHYFGVGIVEPADDFNQANPPSNKQLLEWLTREFVAHQYDIKWLHRTIANSRTYQLSWKPTETNRQDERNFSHARIRRLEAEVTIDAIIQSTASDTQLTRLASETNSRKITQHPKSIQTRAVDYSLLIFGKPLRTTNCDCERQLQPTLLQSLYVRNDEEVLGWLERNDGWLMQVAGQLNQPLSIETAEVAAKRQPGKPAADDESAVPDLDALKELITSAYIRTVSRQPHQWEVEMGLEHFAKAENIVEGLRDLLWALVNTQEFLTNH